MKAEEVINEVKETDQLEVQLKLVRETMKEELDLSYRPLKRIAFQANSARCLILRKLYAETMIALLFKGKRIINVDETWVNLKNYRRRRWRKRGVVNSVNTRTVSPRISFIAAISTEGETYFSLTQVNTDS